MFLKEKNAISNSNLDYGLLLVIFITALVVRLSWIDHPPHLDEIWHFDISYKGNVLDAIAESRNVAHPPLYFILLWLWIPLGNSFEWLRLLPILTGAIGPLFAYGIIKRLGFARMAALSTALVISTLPALSHISVMLRAYSLGQLFLWANLYYFLSIFSNIKRERTIWLLTLSGFFALLSIHAAIFQVTATSIVFFLVYFKKKNEQNKRIKKIVIDLFPHFLILIFPVLLFAFQYKSDHLDHVNKLLYKGNLTDFDTLYSFLIDRTGSYFKGLYKTSVGFEIIFMVFLVFSGWCSVFIRKEKELTIFFFVLFATVIFQIVASVSGQYPFGGSLRHDSPTYPSAILLLSAGLLCLIKKSSLKSNLAFQIVPCIFLLGAHYHFTESFYHKKPRWNLAPAIQTLNKDPKIPVLVDWHGKHIMKFFNYASEISGQNYSILDISKLNSCASTNKNCFIVVGSNRSFDLHLHNLLDKHKNVEHHILSDLGFYHGKAKMFTVKIKE